MLKTSLFAAAAVLTIAPAAAQVSPSALSDRPASTMTPTEIKAHNNALTSDDASYIRCRREPVLGSLAKKLRVCRTNREWAAYSEQGSRTAQELADQVGRVAPQGN